MFSVDALLPLQKTTTKGQMYVNTITNLQLLIDSFDETTPKAIIEKVEVIKKDLEQMDIGNKITLLCDDDIIHLAKILDCKCADELFNRGIRRHPVWKSESEYKIFVDGYIGDESYEELCSQLGVLKRFQDEEAEKPALDIKAIELCETKLKAIESMDLSDEDKKSMSIRYQLLLNWLRMLQKVAKDSGLSDFDYSIVDVSNFQSSFNKEALGEIPINFPQTGKVFQLKNLISLFSVEETKRDKFFYFYYRRHGEETVSSISLGKEMAKLALNTN